MMKTKSKELDVDFIGGQGSLTKEEEQRISEYLKSQRLLREKRKKRVSRVVAKRNKISEQH